MLSVNQLTSVSDDCRIGVYTLTKAVPVLLDTLSDTGTTLSGALDVVAGGVAIVMANPDTPSALTWTSGLTADWDSINSEGASASFTGDSAITVSLTVGTPGANDVLSAVSFRPA